MRLRPGLALLALAACRGAGPAPAPVLARVLAADYARDPKALPDLRRLLHGAPPGLRRLCLRAAGRIGGSEAFVLLAEGLGDPDPEVVAEAAFQLGLMRGEAQRQAARGALLPLLEGRNPRVRARALEALGRLGGPEVESALLEALADPAAEVRGAAALALHRLRRRSLGAGARAPEADARAAKALLAALEHEGSRQAAWREVYALAALARVEALPALLDSAARGRARARRLFALRGLAALARTKGALDRAARARVRAVLLETLHDRDPTLAREAALALGDPSHGGRDLAPRGTPPPFDDPEVFAALEALLLHENPHVAAAAAQAIGHFGSSKVRAREALARAEASRVPTVRAAALAAGARLLGDVYTGILELHIASGDWRIQKGVARALRHLSPRPALRLARKLVATGDTRVIFAVLDALQSFAEDREAQDLALEILAKHDPALVEEAARALRAIGDRAALPGLLRAYRSAAGPAGADARHTVLSALARIAGHDPAVKNLLLEALRTDPSAAVRRRARRLLAQLFPDEAQPEPAPDRGPRLDPLPGRNYEPDFLASRPLLEFVTPKGRFVAELWPGEAPAHCWNLLAYVESGKYAGRIFHRVVPGFVVQGGGARGDGASATAFLGGRLRDEINPRPFLSWTIGMPKSEAEDSGGEQIFVTLAPAPHLDGRYTAFGRIVRGFEVLTRLEEGDPIEEVRILAR